MHASSPLTVDKPKRLAWRQPAVLWVILAVIPLVAVIAFAVLQPVKVRPRIGLAPGYAFTDQNGEQLTSEDMRGKLVMYDFTYTNCAAPCLQTAAAMHDVQALAKRMDTAGLLVELVTISFDPEHDSSEQLRRHAAAIGADTDNWHFVTGAADRLKNVIGGGFGVFYEPDGAGGFTFDPTMVLVDGNGIIRAIYERTLPDMQTIERDLNLVVTEVRNSEGPGKLVYEAAHLFLCYPGS